MKRHKTKWGVCVNLKSGHMIYFTHEEDAKAAAYEFGYAIYPPIYR